MLTLYDNPFSTSAQKVRLVMAEKDVAFESIVLDLQAGEHIAVHLAGVARPQLAAHGSEDCLDAVLGLF